MSNYGSLGYTGVNILQTLFPNTPTGGSFKPKTKNNHSIAKCWTCN